MSLEDIKARAEAATPGPWHVDRDGWIESDLSYPYITSVKRSGDGADADEIEMALPNAEFIANARQDVPKLIRALERILSETEQQPVAHERIFQLIEEATR